MAKEYLKKKQELFESMKNFFILLENEKQDLEEALRQKEMEQEDILHELELAKLNAIELMKTATRLINVRKERRQIKDKLDVIKTEKGFADKYITKGICRDLEQGIVNLTNLENNWKSRKYNAKILEDLKISKEQLNEKM